MREYAHKANGVATMLHHAAGYSYKLHFWPNADGDICSRAGTR